MLDLIVSVIFYVGLGLNFYKIGLMPNQPYNIFPWSPTLNPAKSSPSFLILHTLIALLCSYINCHWYFQQRKVKSNDQSTSNRAAITQERLLERSALFCHMFFALGVIFNISHLGNMDPEKAFMINSIALLGLSLSVIVRKPLTYFLILNFPVYLEVMRLISYAITI